MLQSFLVGSRRFPHFIVEFALSAQNLENLEGPFATSEGYPIQFLHLESSRNPAARVLADDDSSSQLALEVDKALCQTDRIAGHSIVGLVS